MKKRLRLLAWLITLTMLCELLPFSAFAQSDIGQNFTSSVFSLLDEENSEALALGECGDNLKWSLSRDGTLSITGTGEMTNYDILNPAPWLSTSSIKLSIKSVIFSDGITSIGNFAFYSCSNISSATIPATITKIGQFAFQTASESRLSITYSGTTAQWQAIAIEQNNDALDSAIINGHAIIVDSGNCGSDGDNVTWELDNAGVLTIRGTGAIKDYNYSPFSNGITSIVIEDGITRIGSDAFRGLKIKDVSLPDSLTQIGDDAFRGSSLEELTLPEGVKVIGDWAFLGTNLKSIALPSGLIRLGSYAFYKCANLSSVTFSSSPTFIYSSTFAYCTALESIVIPYGVQCIDSQAFYNCTSLTSVTIPSTLVRVSDKAFYNSNVTDVYYEGTKSQSNQIDILGSNEPFSNANWHYQDLAFTFKRDNLSFLNSGDDFFYGNSWDFKHPFQSYYEWLTGPSGNYNISSEAFERLTSPYVPRVVNYLKEKALAKWDGSCSGMSTVVALHYVAPERFPLNSVDASASNVYDLKAPKDDSSVEDLINYYQLLQLTPTMHKLKCDRFYFTAMHFEDSLNEVITELQSGYPVVIGLARNNKFSHGTHAVVLLSLIDDKETSNYYIARVYDPNKRSKSTMKIYKAPYDSKENSGIKISYGRYHLLYRYILTHTDLKYLDIHNFFGLDNNETAKDFDKAFIKSDGSIKATYGKYFVRTENGELVECSSNVTVFKDENTLAEYVDSDDEPDICDFDITFDDIPFASLELHLDSSGVNNASVLLKDTLLSISTTGPADLVYNETARTLDITAENPTDVSLLFTQNGVSTNWPWHSWVIDTTGATEFHASMDDEGLHLNGDGISNAKYATEYMGSDGEDDVISKGTIPAGADNVSIVNKNDGNSNTTDIETPDPVEPTELTVSVSGGTIIQINDDAFAESLTSHTAKQGDKITIMADTTDKFNGWIVNEGDVTLDDATAPTTTFTMNEKSVRITAEYQNNSTDPTPTPTPGGGGSSSGGGGGGGGAAVLIGVGAAAAITAGVIMMSPVDVKGRVVLADQAAVPGAKISLLREGKVVAQTTADENGSFSLKAKRGSYELTAAYTTADGQLIYKTIDIKAPAKDLTVTF